jgi:hypothetical protein
MSSNVIKPEVVFLVLLALTGCQSPQVATVRKELQGEKFYQTFETQEHRVHVQYVPKALRLLNAARLDTGELVNPRVLDSLELAYGVSGLCFHLRISPMATGVAPHFANDLIYGSPGGFEVYRKRLQEFSFLLNEKIWLEVNGQKVKISHYHMENSYGISPARTFVLQFPQLSIEKQTVFSLVLDDILPGMSRRKLSWTIPVGKYDQSI